MSLLSISSSSGGISIYLGDDPSSKDKPEKDKSEKTSGSNDGNAYGLDKNKNNDDELDLSTTAQTGGSANSSANSTYSFSPTKSSSTQRQSGSSIVEQVQQGTPLQVEESADGVILVAGDDSVELTNEQLEQAPQLRRALRLKSNLDNQRVKVNLSSLKIDFSASTATDRSAAVGHQGGKKDPLAAMLDLSVAEILAARQTLDVIA
ncbi:MAG: hypothetical protein KatS3mg111_0861 [Pirellulaceae bacterium]|nr:MAG: hypothetical protein KatS3mg111_0861 [Pirellulaceae bacterium]